MSLLTYLLARSVSYCGITLSLLDFLLFLIKMQSYTDLDKNNEQNLKI